MVTDRLAESLRGPGRRTGPILNRLREAVSAATDPVVMDGGVPTKPLIDLKQLNNGYYAATSSSNLKRYAVGPMHLPPAVAPVMLHTPLSSIHSISVLLNPD